MTWQAAVAGALSVVLLVYWIERRRLAALATAMVASNEPNKRFLYVKFPGDMLPLERGQRFEDPLQELLHDRGIGEVVGGGTSIGEESYTGIDVEVHDARVALPVIIAKLRELQAPSDAVIEEHREEGVIVHEVWPAGSVH